MKNRHDAVRTLILAGFSLLLAKLVVTGGIQQYLAPRFVPLSYVTLAILVVLTGVSLRQTLKGRTSYDCGCQDAHHLPRGKGKALVVYGLFALPLVMGFVMPDKPLDSAVAEKRGVNLLSVDLSTLARAQSADGAGDSTGKPGAGDVSGAGQVTDEPSAGQEQAGDGAGSGSGTDAGLETGSDAGGEGGTVDPSTSPSTGVDNERSSANPAGTPAISEEEALKRFRESGLGDFYADIATFLYKQPTIQLNDKWFLDGLTTLELFPQEFAGRKLETMGFVYRQPGLRDDQFVVARFSVSCCTADANVMGILVESPDAKRFAKDSWVRVSGTLELQTFEGIEMLTLRADRITPVQAPKDPYVYYNFDVTANTQ